MCSLESGLKDFISVRPLRKAGFFFFFFSPLHLHVVLQGHWAENHLYGFLSWEIVIFSAVVHVVLMAHCF